MMNKNLIRQFALLFIFASNFARVSLEGKTLNVSGCFIYLNNAGSSSKR